MTTLCEHHAGTPHPRDHPAARRVAARDARGAASAVDGPDDRPQRGALPSGRPVDGAVRHRQRDGRDPHPLARRSRVTRGGARRRLALRRARAVRRGAALGRRPRARGDQRPRARLRRRARGHRRAPHAAVDHRAAARPTAAQHRRVARRRGVPRRPRADRQAAARDRRRRRPVPAADDPGRSRRPGRREPGAGEQGAVAVHPARLDRGRGAQPLQILDRQALHDRATL